MPPPQLSTSHSSASSASNTRFGCRLDLTAEYAEYAEREFISSAWLLGAAGALIHLGCRPSCYAPLSADARSSLAACYRPYSISYANRAQQPKFMTAPAPPHFPKACTPRTSKGQTEVK